MTDIIEKCQVCHVSMVDQHGMPYVVPMNFGFADEVIYLHSAQTGKIIDILKNNPAVCINFTTDHKLRYQHEEVACSWNMKYRSVLCYGKVKFLDTPDEKVKALNVIMNHYAGKDFSYNDPAIREVNCWIVAIDVMEGRAYGY